MQDEMQDDNQGGDNDNTHDSPKADATAEHVEDATTKGPSPDDMPDDMQNSAPEDAPESSPEDKIADLNDQLLRTLAELENTRKRAERDRGEALKFGAMSFARDMVGVVDNLQRALKAFEDNHDQLPDTVSGLVEGVAATERDLLAALARHKVTALAPMGEKFDPNIHEAMFEAPGTGQENGTIIDVVEAGYMMEERLLRPAKVGIAKD